MEKNVNESTRYQNTSHRKLEKINIKKYYVRYVFYYFANTFITGGMIQSFMLESGITSGQVSVYTAVIQIVQAAAMLLLGPVIEKQKNIVRINADANILLFPLCICMLVISIFTGLSPAVKYVLILVSSVIAYISYAVTGIIEYKMPYLIIDMENYGHVVLMAGFCIGLTSMTATALFSFLIRRFDYFNTAAVFLAAGLIMYLVSAYIGRSYKVINPYDISSSGDKAKRRDGIFSYGPFRKLLIPNFLRGFSSGTFALLTTVGYYYKIVDSKTAALMVVISNIVIMAGCIIYARVSERRIDGPLTAVSSMVLCVLMPAMLIGKNTLLFIVLYSVGVFFKNIIDYSCPVICAAIVDYEHAGEFSSWRIALYMLGAAVSGLVTIPMLGAVGGIMTMLLNGMIFAVTGICYYSVSRSCQK